tara:strand:+ start:38 stop:250 length:213 start_codon:yes stop_codon:yes gene_type:complete
MSNSNSPEREEILDAIEDLIIKATDSLVEESYESVEKFAQIDINKYKKLVFDVLMGEIYVPIAFGEHGTD